MISLCDAARHVLETADASEKVRLTKLYADQWKNGQFTDIGAPDAPDTPARPSKPELRSPKDMPRRRLGSEAGRIALIHAIAHIELNAIDLAWDIIARFSAPYLPKDFYDDWVEVAFDESIHFDLLNNRLHDFNLTYGDHPAHNGLWDTAYLTRNDLMARLALVPMLLEPRGLDTTPQAVERLRRMGDDKTADIMERIGYEEIAHVRAGTRWFNFMAERNSINPQETYQNYVRNLFNGTVKSPFNTEARDQAGLSRDYYEPVSDLA